MKKAILALTAIVAAAIGILIPSSANASTYVVTYVVREYNFQGVVIGSLTKNFSVHADADAYAASLRAAITRQCHLVPTRWICDRTVTESLRVMRIL